MAEKIARIGKTHRTGSILIMMLLALFFSGIYTEAAERTMRIMCIGDSITAGYTDKPSWNYEFTFSYRLGLYKRMTNAGYTIQYVGSSIEPWNGLSGYPKKIGQPDLRELDQDYHNG